MKESAQPAPGEPTPGSPLIALYRAALVIASVFVGILLPLYFHLEMLRSSFAFFGTTLPARSAGLVFQYKLDLGVCLVVQLGITVLAFVEDRRRRYPLGRAWAVACSIAAVALFLFGLPVD